MKNRKEQIAIEKTWNGLGYKEGTNIQFRWCNMDQWFADEWFDCTPDWGWGPREYRIKPETI